MKKTDLKRISLKEVLNKEMQDPDFFFYFEREKSISEIAKLVRDARIQSGLTQSRLARLSRSSQSVIARLESGSDQRIPSLELLERIACALKARLLVSFEFKKAA